MAVPYSIYFMLLGLLLTFASSYKILLDFVKKTDAKSVKVFIPFLLTILAFVLALLFDHSKQLIVYKELANIPLLLSLLLLFAALVDSTEKIKEFIKVFSVYYLSIIFIISLLAAFKFWLMLKGVHIQVLVNHDKYPWGFSLSTDYNYYSVAITLALLLLLWADEQLFTRRFRWLEYGFFAILCTNLFFSCSRRGFIILLIVIVFQVIVSLYRFLRSKKIDQVLWKSLLGLLVILIHIYFLYFSSFQVRKYSGMAIAAYGIDYKKEITAIGFRYLTIVNPKADYKLMYKNMWPREVNNSHLSEESTPEPIYEKTTYGSRIERWNYGWSMFSKKYSLLQQIVGSGFSYLRKYAIRFRVIEFNPYDYPHNPLIAALLYSGIVGFLFLSAYLAYSMLLIYQLKLYNITFLIVYFTISFFSLLSGNSYFSIPIYVAITLIPYYMAFITKKSTQPKVS